MRVISGKTRGTRLFSPQNKFIRPTSDYVKENLFNIIQGDIMGCNFLDLFAGSGAIGIEALSRGAKTATFIDFAPQSVNLIQRNLEETKLADLSTVMKGDVPLIFKKLEGQKFDIIFLDPPYFRDFASRTLEGVLEHDILSANGYIILESENLENLEPPKGLEITQERTYGNSRLIFISFPKQSGNMSTPN